MRLLTRALLLTGSTLITLPTLAAEGMWTLDNLPHENLEKPMILNPLRHGWINPCAALCV